MKEGILFFINFLYLVGSSFMKITCSVAVLYILNQSKTQEPEVSWMILISTFLWVFYPWLEKINSYNLNKTKEKDEV